jgi:hypothetical protein
MTGILLSKLELDMLRSPEKLNARQKRNLSYRLKTRGSEIGKALQELELLVNNVPDETLKEAVSNKTFFSLKTILEKLLQIRAPWPVGVDKNDSLQIFRVFGNATPSADLGKCSIFSISREATYEEIELDFYLTELYNKLQYYIDPCIPDSVCRTPKTLMDEDKQVLEPIKGLNKSFTISHNAYLDETGVSEHLWVVRKPSMVDIAQLSWMRWKPRDLKECLELPPLLKEKNFTVNWKEEASISNSSSPAEIERFKEIIQKQNQAPKLTEEQLAEINRKLNSSG